ncbi:WecB/TagA/CpsF family glycosyltransferase [Fusibacter sp. JL216-2]|uniref:WecB/TagA/CpsF family glycosyltransferase n=1 Tax=Fusibacter sp. JL216-2 TaxID=3071453 RepID=UPI003D354DC4
MDTKSVKILGVRIDKLNADEAYNKFLSLFKQGTFNAIYTPNPEIIMMAQEDQDLKDALLDASLVIPDGIGVIYASRIHNLGLEERLPGIEFMERMLKFCNNTNGSIFILGGKPGIPEKACNKIKDKYPNIEIAGYHDGYFKDDDELRVVDKINEVKPDILFVALGCPKQEKWIYEHRKILNTKIAMGVGGSVDVWAGSSKRAPKIFIDLNLEWFYRLLREPSRIGRMMSLPKFLIKVLLSRDVSK